MRTGNTEILYDMPDYSKADYFFCKVGAHIVSRKKVVQGWSGGELVKRYYCACGSHCWIWIVGGFVNTYVGKRNQHLEWIKGREEMDRFWEEVLSEHRSRHAE